MVGAEAAAAHPHGRAGVEVDPEERALLRRGDHVAAVLRQRHLAGIRKPLDDPVRAQRAVADEEAERRLAGEQPLPGTRLDESDSKATKRRRPRSRPGRSCRRLPGPRPGRDRRARSRPSGCCARTRRACRSCPRQRGSWLPTRTRQAAAFGDRDPRRVGGGVRQHAGGRDVHPGRVRRSRRAGRRHRADDDNEHRDPSCCSSEAHLLRLLERDDTKSRRPTARLSRSGLGRSADPEPHDDAPRPALVGGGGKVPRRRRHGAPTPRLACRRRAARAGHTSCSARPRRCGSQAARSGAAPGPAAHAGPSRRADSVPQDHPGRLAHGERARVTAGPGIAQPPSRPIRQPPAAPSPRTWQTSTTRAIRVPIASPDEQSPRAPAMAGGALVLLAIWAAGIGGRAWVEGQWRAVVVLAGSLHTPVVSDTGILTDAPSVRDVRMGRRADDHRRAAGRRAAPGGRVPERRDGCRAARAVRRAADPGAGRGRVHRRRPRPAGARPGRTPHPADPALARGGGQDGLAPAGCEPHRPAWRLGRMLARAGRGRGPARLGAPVRHRVPWRRSPTCAA